MVAVLLAEQNPILRKDTAQALELHGYAVIQAKDSQSLVEILDRATHLPDVVVSDIRLFNCRMSARFGHNRSGIPVLFLSALHLHPLDLCLEDLPTEDIILKPFRVDELILAIERKLNRF